MTPPTEQIEEAKSEAPIGPPPESESEDENDSLHILPLRIIPLETQALKSAKLVKNFHLQSVVELFNEKETGSGQVPIDELDGVLGWDKSVDVPDRTVLRKLGSLPSYDVYSLRIMLRRHGIAVNDYNDLKLSAKKNDELREYMKVFTQPLIREIYGDHDVDVENTNDLVDLFRDPDVSKARERLRTMADKLEITVDEVPNFLADYGDIFLSLSFFRQCLDRVTPTLTNFMQSMDTIRSNWQMRNDTRLIQTCLDVESRINELTAMITGRFESFDRSSKEMWDNISAERFRKVEALIKNHHTSTAAVLCGLSIKMRSWQRQFPNAESTGPIKLAEFITAEMRQGIESIRKIDATDPMLAELD